MKLFHTSPKLFFKIMKKIVERIPSTRKQISYCEMKKTKQKKSERVLLDSAVRTVR